MSEVRGECRLVKDDRKATVTQITTRYNQGMQNTISERTTRRTLKQMGYSSRRPLRVTLLSAKNRNRRIQFTQAHQDWTIEDLQCIQAIHLYCQYMCSLGIEPTTFALLTQCSNHWATGTLSICIYMLSCQYGPKSLRNVSTPCWIYATKN